MFSGAVVASEEAGIVLVVVGVVSIAVVVALSVSSISLVVPVTVVPAVVSVLATGGIGVSVVKPVV